MNVKELRDKLTQISDDMNVVVYWEDGAEHQHFDIEDVSAHKGTPRRLAPGKAGFTFEQKGSTEWLFISISPH
jgi:hypothetical protein